MPRPLLLALALTALALPACDAVDSSADAPDAAIETADGASADYKDSQGRLRVDFNRFATTTRYRKWHAEDDFDPNVSWASANDWTSRGDLMQVVSKQLRFRLPPGVTGDGTGGKIRVPLRARSGYYIQYDVRFDDGFDFTPPSGGSNGGKLPGLAGGDGNTGCNKASGSGFSSRMMWRGDRTSSSSTAKLYAYVYYKDQAENCGTYFDTGYTVQDNTWYTVRMYVGMNTGNNKDGTLRVWVKRRSDSGFGNSRVSKTDIRWMDTNHKVDEALIQVFNGGSGSKWYLSTESFIRLDNIYTCHQASECDGL